MVQDVIKVFGSYTAAIIQVFEKPFLSDKPNIGACASSIGLIVQTVNQCFGALTEMSDSFEGVLGKKERHD